MDMMAGGPAPSDIARIRWSESSDAMEQLATVIQCEVGDTVYRCGESSLYWYRIVKGSVRKCALSATGQRQIVDFLVPENLFGFGENGVHHFCAEVITRGTIIRYPRHAAEQLADRDPQVGRWLRKQAFDSISRLQARALILGRAGALARVSAFLLEWTDRCCPAHASVISLPMSRYDIADYVSMAVETVSRALTILRDRQVIALCGTRRLRICDRGSLERFKEGGNPLPVGLTLRRDLSSRATAECR